MFDPKAQIRVSFTDVKYAEGEGTIDLEIYSINQVEFIGEGFRYRYYNGGTLIPELSKDVGLAFYVAPSDNPGRPGEITKITDLPLYYQQVEDYVTMNPKITEIACTVSLVGTDGAGHDIAKSITVDFPAVQPGVDFEPPNAVITVSPGTVGSAPFIVQFDASQSTDNRGIASYSWDFGDGKTGTGIMPAPHTYTCGTYIVKLTVTDYWDNVGYDTVVINVGETGGPSVIIEVTPGTTGKAPFTVHFDASKTKFENQCGVGNATYHWDFGDGNEKIGITTSHTYENGGTYIVVLTVIDQDGKKGYATVTIDVDELAAPSVVIEVTPSTSGSAPFKVFFDASKTQFDSPSAASGATYHWDFGDGKKKTGITTSHIYENDGVYTVILTVIDSEGNKGYASVVIKVGVVINAVIVTTPTPAIGFAPFTVGFDASESTTTAPEAKIDWYRWKFSDSDEVTTFIPVISHKYDNPGTYLVQLTVGDNKGNVGYAFVSIEAKDPDKQ